MKDKKQSLASRRPPSSLVGRFRVYPDYRDSDIDWLAETPAHWTTKRLKHLCLRSALYGANESASSYVNDGIRFLRTTDISEQGELVGDGVFLEPALVRDYELASGDLLISRSGTIGRAFLFDATQHGPCAYAGYLVRFVPNATLVPRFAFYFTKSKSFQHWLRLSVISSTIGNVNGQKYANMQIPHPPVDEQRAIAAFLDRETGRIDELIAKKQRLIELLAEKRTALISHAVTKGLNPDAPMKDSGIAWLGEIPSAWTVHQLRRVVRRFVDYRGRTPTKTDSGIPLITAGAVRDGSIDHSRAPEYMAEDDYQDWMCRGWPEKDDVVITTEAPLAEVALVEDVDVAFAQRIILFKLNRSRVHPEWIRYYYLSKAGCSELLSRASGSTATGIRADRLRMSLVLVPPLDEQRAISEYLNPRVAALTAPVDPIQSGIAALREYRSALISAAVTGKIDVREEPV